MTTMIVEQDTELGQLCRDLEQLRDEKAKESERADKLAKELKGEYFLVGVNVELLFLFDGTL